MGRWCFIWGSSLCRRLSGRLMEAGMDAATPAAVIRWGTRIESADGDRDGGDDCGGGAAGGN